MKRPKPGTATRAASDEIVAAAKKILPARQAQLRARHRGALMGMQQSLRAGKRSLEQVRQALVATLTEVRREAREEPGAQPMQGDNEDVAVQPGAPRPTTSACAAAAR